MVKSGAIMRETGPAYPSIDIQRIENLTSSPQRVIVVLSGGITDQGRLNERSKLNVASACSCASSILDGTNHQGESAFIFSGGIVSMGKNEAQVMTEAFLEGMAAKGSNTADRLRIYLEDKSNSTATSIHNVMTALHQINYQGLTIIICDSTQIKRVKKRLHNRGDKNIPTRTYVMPAESLILGLSAQDSPAREEAEQIVRNYHQSAKYADRVRKELAWDLLDSMGAEDLIINLISSLRKALQEKQEAGSQGVIFQLDHYLRRKDTPLYQTLHTLSPLQGVKYRESEVKDLYDKVLALPIAGITLPLLGLVALLIKGEGLIDKESKGPVFYYQERYDQQGRLFKVRKFRTMKKDSEPTPSTPQMAAQFTPEDDPRVTRVGKILRMLDIDEVPQIWQVLQGVLSLVGFRAIAPYARDFMQKVLSPCEYEKWWRGYAEDEPSLFSLAAAISPNRKNDKIRPHADQFYRNHASLGFDMYTIFRSGVRIIRKIARKTISKI